MAGDPAGLSLGLDRHRLTELERSSGRGRGALADEDLTRFRRRSSRAATFTASPVTNELPLARPADDDVAGVDADAQRERPAEELLEPLSIESAACSARSA